MLEGSNFRKPTNLFVHGYVTVNGAKMSKSRGTFIKASTWLNHFDAGQPALLLHREALFPHRRYRPESGRFRAARERGHRQQGGEPGVP